MDRSSVPFDIKERTFLFGVRIVKLVNVLPRSIAGIEIGRQVIRSGTSIGANVEEADGAESKKDFIHKMSIARKEVRETRYWLRIIQTSLLDNAEVADLIQESDQLVRILSRIIANAKKSLNQ
ncbi:MAG: four helix bundle protein [Chloroflexi bacterium]|nr:four helix bundle protein [Anaerolineae bacterium]RLC69373.1 MAG: four helix bundle protein [Chloroflexota bacterium]